MSITGGHPRHERTHVPGLDDVLAERLHPVPLLGPPAGALPRRRPLARRLPERADELPGREPVHERLEPLGRARRVLLFPLLPPPLLLRRRRWRRRCRAPGE